VKKVLVLGLAVAALAVAAPTFAGQGGGDAQGPSCADIVNGSGSYASDGTVTVLVDYASAVDASACGQVVYHVYADTAQGTVELTLVQAADADTLVFRGTVDTSNASVCISASTTIESHVIDNAPDSGCFSLPKNASPGFGGFS
jgi:hypothetical protein